MHYLVIVFMLGEMLCQKWVKTLKDREILGNHMDNLTCICGVMNKTFHMGFNIPFWTIFFIWVHIHCALFSQCSHAGRNVMSKVGENIERLCVTPCLVHLWLIGIKNGMTRLFGSLKVVWTRYLCELMSVRL